MRILSSPWLFGVDLLARLKVENPSLEFCDSAELGDSAKNLLRLFLRNQRRKKRTRPPPKENLLGNFFGPKEKLSRPVVDTKTL